MLEHYLRTLAPAGDLPNLLTEAAETLKPRALPFRVRPVRRYPPVVELKAIDVPDRSEPHAILSALRVGYDCNRPTATSLGQLYGLGTEATRATPDENQIAVLHAVRWPAVKHSIGGGTHQIRRCGLCPAQLGGLGKTLVCLSNGKLGERPEIRVVTPDSGGRGQHRVPARLHPGVFAVPVAGMDHDLVPDVQVRNTFAECVDHAGGVASSNVEVARISFPLADTDDVDRLTACCPNVVVVDPGSHNPDEHLIGL